MLLLRNVHRIYVMLMLIYLYVKTHLKLPDIANHLLLPNNALLLQKVIQ